MPTARSGTLARAALLALGVLAAACDGASGSDASPSAPVSSSASPSPSPSVSASGAPSASPTPQPSLQLPPDGPSAVGEPEDVARITAGDFAALVPPDAEIGFREALDDPIDQIALAWRRGADPFASEHGFVIWQAFDDPPMWRAVYAFTDKPAKGVLGVSVESGDLTGDGVPDLLTREDVGGSGACAIWRVVVPTTGNAGEVLRRTACDTEIMIAGDALSTREAVYEPNDAHCCPSALRYATLEWDGERFVVTSENVEPAG
jgi:hypothetical protein